jgi:hypothetical protein
VDSEPKEAPLAENEGIRIPLPPRDSRIQDFPPVIDPALRDIPEYDGPLGDSTAQVVESVPVEGQPELEQLRHAAEETALNDERVQRRLGDRYEVIGVSLIEAKAARSFTPLLVIYNYDENTTVEVSLTGGSDMEVIDVATTNNQPAPTDKEIERAIRLARDDHRIAGSLADEFEAVASLASAVDTGDRYQGRRCFAVGFGPADERLPRVRALVDLTRERVLGFSTDGEGP